MLDLSNEGLRERSVRLFPCLGIGSEKEAERRSVASLLAMVLAVSEFGKRLVRRAGGPAGRISCFTEIPFPALGVAKSEAPRPDGLIRVVRGRRSWSALVEVKVGHSPIEQAQFTTYHRLAADHGIDALITISNEAANALGHAPVKIDGRRLRKVPVYHWSWESIESEARYLSNKRAVQDSDQSWMLAEWIKYLEDPKSRVIARPQLGQHWAEIVRAARDGQIASKQKQLTNLVDHWVAYLRKESFRLRARLGVDVEVWMPRKLRKNPHEFRKHIRINALDTNCLTGRLRIPNAVGDLEIKLNLAARRVHYAVSVAAPDKGRSATRIKWLLRQLNAEVAPRDLAVTVSWRGLRVKSTHSLAKLHERMELAFVDTTRAPISPKADPTSFLLEWGRPLTAARGKSTERVLEGVSRDLEAFYRHVVENLVPPVKRAPKLPEDSKGPSTVSSPAQAQTPDVVDHPPIEKHSGLRPAGQ